MLSVATSSAAPSSVPKSLFSSQRKRSVILALVLVAATLGAYNPISHNGFINFDDTHYVSENPHIQQGLTWPTVQWAFTSYEFLNWHPITWLSHALDYQLFKSNPLGHHYTSVLLHTLNALLLFFLLQRATGFTWGSVVVAALFALHPINVESVAWIAERKNVLSTLFMLLALHSYGWYARKPAVGRYLAVALFFALGLMSKPQIITLPFALLLWDYWPLRRFSAENLLPGASISVTPPSVASLNEASNETAAAAPSPPSLALPPRQPLSRLVVEKIPLLLLSAASAWVTVRTQLAGATTDSAGRAIQTAFKYPFAARLENAVVGYARYLGKAFWPSKLALLYPHTEGYLPAWQVAGCAVLLVAVTCLVIRGRRHRYLPVGWFWFLGTLVPMIGVVQVGVQAIADRYAYQPLIGIFIIVVWGAADLSRRWRVLNAWPATAAVLTLAILAATTRNQVEYWENSGTIWAHTVEVTEHNYLAHDYLGAFLLTNGQPEEAMVQMREAVDLFPQDAQALLNIGLYYQSHGDNTAAIKEFENVLGFSPDPGFRAAAYTDLGYVYRGMRDDGRAKQNFLSALRNEPKNLGSLLGLGLIAQKSGDLQEAVSRYSAATVAAPNDFGYLLLAQALQQAGRSGEADAANEKARQLSPNLQAAQKIADSLLHP